MNRRVVFFFTPALPMLMFFALGTNLMAGVRPGHPSGTRSTSVSSLALPAATRLCPDVDSIYYGSNEVLLPLITPMNSAGGTAALWRVNSDTLAETVIYLPGQLVCGVDVILATVSATDVAVLPTDGFLNQIDLATNASTWASLPNRLRPDVDIQLSSVGSPGPRLLMPIVGGLTIYDLGSSATTFIPIPTDLVPGVDLVLTPGGAFGLLPTNGVLYKIDVAAGSIAGSIPLTGAGLLIPDLDAVVLTTASRVIVPVRNALHAINYTTMATDWAVTIPSDLVPGADLRLRPSDNGQVLVPSIAHLSFVNTTTGAITSTLLAGRLREQIDAYYAVSETRAIIPVLPAGGTDFNNNLDIFNTATGALIAAPVIDGDIEVAVDVGLDTDASAVMPTMGFVHFIDLTAGVVTKTLTTGRLRPDVDLLIMPSGGKAAFPTSRRLYLFNAVPSKTGFLPVSGSVREIDLAAQSQTTHTITGEIMIGVDAAGTSNTAYFNADEDMVCWVCYPLKVRQPNNPIPPYIDNRGLDPLSGLTAHRLANGSIGLASMDTGVSYAAISTAQLGNRSAVGTIEVDPLNQMAVAQLSQTGAQQPAVAIIDLWRFKYLATNYLRIVTLPYRPVWKPVFDPDNAWVFWRLSNGWIYAVNLFSGQPTLTQQPTYAAIGQPFVDTLNKRYIVRTRRGCIWVHDLLTDTGQLVADPGGAIPLTDPVVDTIVRRALVPYSNGKLGVIDTELVSLSLVSVNPINLSCANSSGARTAVDVTLDHTNSTAIIRTSDGCGQVLDLGRLSTGSSFFDVFFEIQIPATHQLNGTPEFDSNNFLAVVPIVSRTDATSTNLAVVDLLGSTSNILAGAIQPGRKVSVIGPLDTWWEVRTPGQILGFRVEPHKHKVGVRTLNGFAMLDLWGMRWNWFQGQWNIHPIQWWTWYAYSQWWPNWRIVWWDYDWVNDWTLLYMRNVASPTQYDLTIIDMDSFQNQPVSGFAYESVRFNPWQLNAGVNAQINSWLHGPWWWYFNIWTKCWQSYTLNGKILTLRLYPWMSNRTQPGPNDLPTPVLSTPSSPPQSLGDTIAPRLTTTNVKLDWISGEGLAVVRGSASAADPFSTLIVTFSIPSPPPPTFFDVFYDGSFGGQMPAVGAADDASLFIPAQPGDTLQVMACDAAANCSATVTFTVPFMVNLPIILKGP